MKLPIGERNKNYSEYYGPINGVCPEDFIEENYYVMQLYTNVVK